MYVKIQ